MENEKKKKVIKIKTNLWTGIIFTVICVALLIAMPKQVRIPKFDSGAPSPRVLPSICLYGMLICSVYLIFQSVVLKQEKIYEWDYEKEMPIIIITLLMLAFVACTRLVGFVAGGIISLTAVLVYLREKKLPIYIFTWACIIGAYFMFKYIFNVSLPSFEISVLGSLIGG